MKKIIKHSKSSEEGFTLIELLVVIAIIGLLATMSVVALSSAREKARDSRRMSDIKQVQTALEMYYSSSSTYPVENSGAALNTVDLGEYMDSVPHNPTPADDGDCNINSQADYGYYSDNGSDYVIMYCVGSEVADLEVGTHCATPDSISDSDKESASLCDDFSSWPTQ